MKLLLQTLTRNFNGGKIFEKEQSIQIRFRKMGLCSVESEKDPVIGLAYLDRDDNAGDQAFFAFVTL
jgi:hypothetical protein